MAEQQPKPCEKRERIAHELHTRVGSFRPLEPGYTPQERTGQEADFEPEEVEVLKMGPGYTPEAEADLIQEELCEEA